MTIHDPHYPKPKETPQEDVRNALALLKASADWECVSTHAGDPMAVYMKGDVDAVVTLLTSAVSKLEGK